MSQIAAVTEFLMFSSLQEKIVSQFEVFYSMPIIVFMIFDRIFTSDTYYACNVFKHFLEIWGDIANLESSDLDGTYNAI